MTPPKHQKCGLRRRQAPFTMFQAYLGQAARYPKEVEGLPEYPGPLFDGRIRLRPSDLARETPIEKANLLLAFGLVMVVNGSVPKNQDFLCPDH